MVARIWSELNLVVDYNTDMLRRDIFNKIGVASNESSWAVLTNTDDIVAIVNISIYKEDTLVPYYYADGSIVEAAKNFLLRMGLGLADNIVPAYETMQSAIEAAQATIVRHEFDHPVEGTKAIVDIPKYASQNIAYFLVKALADTFKGHVSCLLLTVKILFHDLTCEFTGKRAPKLCSKAGGRDRRGFTQASSP